LNITALAFARATKENTLSFHGQRNALTVFLAFPVTMALLPVLTNLVLARKQLRCLRLINCYIGRFYGRCPNPQAFKKA